MAQACLVAIPPEAPMSHAEFCKTLTIPEGPYRGRRYNPDTDPVHAVLCREITKGTWQRIVGVGAVQTGKSLALIQVPMLRHLTLLREPVVYSQPTLTKLHEAWAGKLGPNIRDSGYGGWLPTEGQGSKGSQTPKFVTYRDPITRARAGTQYMIPGGGSSEAAQAGVTGRLVAVDEIDSFPDRHRVELVAKRADSYGPQALRIYTSTVKRDEEEGPDASIILALYTESTASRLWFQCPACNHWQTMEWERISYTADNEPAAIATARYACAGCAMAWTEDDRQRALRSWRLVHKGQTVDQATGTVVGLAPETVAFGLLWTALDSSLRSMGQLAAEHWRASRSLLLGDHGPMRSFVRDQLCQRYHEPEPEGEITAAGLARCSDRSTINKRTVPAWARFLVLTQDVQGDRHYWLLVAHGEGDRWGVVDWGYEYLTPEHSKRAPTPEDRRRVLDIVRDLGLSGWQVEGGEDRMYPVSQGVDGGYLMDEIAAWVQGEPSWKFLRGVGRDEIKHSDKGMDRPLPKEITKMNTIQCRRPEGWRIYWWKVNGDYFRRAAHSALLRDADQVASGMVPRGLRANADLLLHLSGEVWDAGDVGKKGYWREVRKRHDYLDCLVYNLALALLHRHMPDSRNPSPPKRKYGVVGTAFGV